jgi:hypothetical protein
MPEGQDLQGQDSQDLQIKSSQPSNARGYTLGTYHADKDVEKLSGCAHQRVCQRAKGFNGKEYEQLPECPAQAEKKDVLSSVGVTTKE